MNKLKELGMKYSMKLSWFWSIFSALYIMLVTFVDVPLANERVVDQVLGFIMGTIVATVINFWLGSSLGSKSTEDQNKSEVVNVDKTDKSSTGENIG